MSALTGVRRTEGRTHKFRNVAANGNVAIVMDDLASVDPWVVRGIEIRGHSEALTDQPTAQPWTGAELIRIHPQRIVTWGVDPDWSGMRGRSLDRGAR